MYGIVFAHPAGVAAVKLAFGVNSQKGLLRLDQAAHQILGAAKGLSGTGHTQKNAVALPGVHPAAVVFAVQHRAAARLSRQGQRCFDILLFCPAFSTDHIIEPPFSEKNTGFSASAAE